MDIRVLYTLVAIAEHGSFLAASRALGLSPAAISLHVKIIEDELGQALFDRSVRPPVLTEFGRRTLARARRVLEEWERLGDTAPGDVGGTLSLGAVPTVIAGLVAPALAQLAARQPRLAVALTTDYAEELEERLARGAIDAALTMEPASPPPSFRFARVLIEPFEVVAPVSAAARSDGELLASLPYIRFRRHAWIAHLVERELARRHLRLDTRMEVDTLSGAFALVEAGLGVSILPARQVAWRGGTKLRAVPFGEPAVTRTIGLLWRPDHPKAPQIDELKAALLAVSAPSPAEPEAERQDEPVNSREA